MKNYGKRKIPRDIWEFKDLIQPFYEQGDYAQCIAILISFWKRKGKSHSTAYFITAGIFSCTFKGNMEINMRFIYSKYSASISDFVYEHLDEFLPYYYEQFISKYGTFNNFINKYYKSIEWKIPINLIEQYKSIEYLQKIAPEELKYKRSWIYGIENKRLELLTNTLIEFDLEILAKAASENFRTSKGLNPVGTHWVSEQYLLDKVKTTLPKYVVIGQGNPIWLKKQRFDIWLPEINAAIEYNGLQHYEPVEYFGGKVGFEATKERDVLKRKKCKLNNVALLEVREGYNFKTIEEWLDKKIEKSRTNL